MKHSRTLFSILLMALAGSLQAAPLGTAFTYQGKLNDGPNVVTGLYDFQFSLWDAQSGGAQTGSIVPQNATPVTNGLFNVSLDFGAAVFDGNARWLQINVRTNGAGGFTTLTPRQQLTPTPYALFASNSATLGGQAPGAFAPASGSSTYVAKAGDTMTGRLNLPANGLAAGGNQLVISSGNVGILKTTPATALDVNGTVTATTFSGSGANLTGIGTLALADNSVTPSKLANDSGGLTKVSGGQMYSSGGNVHLNTAYFFLHDNEILLRNDFNHGLGWYGASKLFAGVNLDGPVLYGCAGGGLGTMCGSGQALALEWNNTGNVWLDPKGLNAGTLLPGLTFGPSSSEGISSKRTAGNNQYGLDFYTQGRVRVTIDNAGRVGIGTTVPNDATLDVRGDIRIPDTQLLLRGDRHHGLAWKDSAMGLHFDGPFLYGWEGGALGTADPDSVTLKWDFVGNVWVSNNVDLSSLVVDRRNANTNGLTPGLVFGAGSGEGISSKRDAGGNQFGLDFYTSFQPRVSIANNGNVGIGRQPTANKLEVEGNASKTTATAWLANSDARIKTGVQTITNALDKLTRVRLVNFHYTEDYRAQHPSVEDRAYANVVAQEFQEVFPDSVKSGGDKLADGSEILQVDTHPLTIYSAAAVQELNQELKAKDARIAELEHRLEKIEQMLNGTANK